MVVIRIWWFIWSWFCIP